MCRCTPLIAGILATTIPIIITVFLLFTLDESGESMFDITISRTIRCTDDLNEWYYPAVGVFSTSGIAFIFLIIWRFNIIRSNLIECGEYTTSWKLLNYCCIVGIIGSVSLILVVYFCVPDYPALHGLFATLFFWCFVAYQISHFILSVKEVELSLNCH